MNDINDALDEIEQDIQDKSKNDGPDLDKNSKHSIRMMELTNFWEFVSHKSFLLVVAIIIFLIWLVFRWLSRGFSGVPILKTISEDLDKAMTFFVGAVVSWIINNIMNKDK